MKEYMNINKLYNGNPDWNIAGLFAHDDFWIPFLNGLKNNGISLPFQYIYGTPTGLEAGGGRNTNPKENFSNMTNREIFNEYINLGIGCRLSLSNHLLTKEHYHEKKLNNILNFLNNYANNGVIISDDNFNDYIKNNYPNLQRICSVIRPAIDVGWGNDTAEYYNNLCEKYDIVVVNCGFAKDLNKINQLEYKDQIEVLVNSRCTLNCPLAKMHYDIVAEGYLIDEFDDVKNLELETREKLLLDKCSEIKQRDLLSGSNFYPEEIQILLDNGIHHFKLEGRNWLVETMVRDVGYYICDELILARLCKNGMGADI